MFGINCEQEMRLLPKSAAPDISKIVAKKHACRMVKTPEPTEVPKELATSLAPTPKARKKAIIQEKTTMAITVESISSMMIMNEFRKYKQMKISKTKKKSHREKMIF